MHGIDMMAWINLFRHASFSHGITASFFSGKFLYDKDKSRTNCLIRVYVCARPIAVHRLKLLSKRPDGSVDLSGGRLGYSMYFVHLILLQC